MRFETRRDDARCKWLIVRDEDTVSDGFERDAFDALVAAKKEMQRLEEIARGD